EGLADGAGALLPSAPPHHPADARRHAVADGDNRLQRPRDAADLRAARGRHPADDRAVDPREGRRGSRGDRPSPRAGSAMDAPLLGELVNDAIMFGFGLVFALIGFGVIGRDRKGRPPRFASFFKVAGPALMGIALLLA